MNDLTWQEYVFYREFPASREEFWTPERKLAWAYVREVLRDVEVRYQLSNPRVLWEGDR